VLAALLCSSGLGQLVLVEVVHVGDGIEVSSNCGGCRRRARWLGCLGWVWSIVRIEVLSFECASSTILPSCDGCVGVLPYLLELGPLTSTTSPCDEFVYLRHQHRSRENRSSRSPAKLVR
jgi:hypothetical protein